MFWYGLIGNPEDRYDVETAYGLCKQLESYGNNVSHNYDCCPENCNLQFSGHHSYFSLVLYYVISRLA